MFCFFFWFVIVLVVSVRLWIGVWRMLRSIESKFLCDGRVVIVLILLSVISLFLIMFVLIFKVLWFLVKLFNIFVGVIIFLLLNVIVFGFVKNLFNLVILVDFVVWRVREFL